MRNAHLLAVVLVVIHAAQSMAGNIERSLGGDRLAHKTLESLSYSDLNSRALDSFVEGVGQLARHPDLSSLPKVQVGRRTVSLDALSPLVEMSRKLAVNPASLASSQMSPLSPAIPSAQSVMSVVSPTSSFAMLEAALEAAPLPASARADLTRVVQSVRDFAGSK